MKILITKVNGEIAVETEGEIYTEDAIKICAYLISKVVDSALVEHKLPATEANINDAIVSVVDNITIKHGHIIHDTVDGYIK